MVENYLLEACKHRFFQLQSYFSSCQALLDEATKDMTDAELEDKVDDVACQLEPKFQALEQVHGIPTDVEVVRDEPLPAGRIEAWLQGFEDWVAGTAGEDETASLIHDIEIYFEVDALWLLFGLPNFSVSEEQRSILSEAIAVIGSAFERDAQAELTALCEKLRSLDFRRTA